MSGVALPVVNNLVIRPSKSGRRRAMVLIIVHLLVAIHIALWLRGGETMTPLEPSESMEFSKHSIINAGLIFFALTILSTLIFGRWFCGWACHLVALQDLSRWILAKFKLRPKAVRLGILGTVPLIAFVYMFIGPVIYRLLHGDSLGVRGYQLTTDTFWATFPSWIPAVLTFLVCGFAIIYLLGAKGFCTYGCPYGAIFGVVDQLAVGSIRVTDACKGCGHCTAVCSSNVRVHQEVRDYGMVVDPGCMKCLDCVSVCPNDALYFGVGKPSMFVTRRTRSSAAAGKLAAALPAWLLIGVFMSGAYSLFMWFDGDLDWRITAILTAGSLLVAGLFKGRAQRLREYGLAEQAVLGAVFLASIFAFRGLYGLVPFLFSLGLAAILAYLALCFVRLISQKDLRVHGWSLKRAGRLRPAGVVFAVGAVGAGALAIHSGAVQYHVVLGRQAVYAASLDHTDTAAVHAGLNHVSRGYELSLVPNHYDLAAIARLHLLDGDDGQYERLLRRASAKLPHDAKLRLELGDHYGSRGRLAEALDSYRAAAQLDPDLVEAYVNVGRSAALLGRLDEARAAFDQALARDPNRPTIWLNYGVLESMLGRHDQAIAHFERAVELDPRFVAALENLAGMYCQVGRFQEGIARFNEALKLSPDDPETHELIARAYLALGQFPQARTHLQRALEVDPGRATARRMLDEIEALQQGTSEVSVEDEVAANVLSQAVGDHTLGAFGFPEPFVQRVADRIIRESYRQRHRQVSPGEGGGETAAPQGPASELIEVSRVDVPDETRRLRARFGEDRPPLRGFRAPIGALTRPPTETPVELRAAAQFVAENLAADGLLSTLVRAIEHIGPDRLLDSEDGFELLGATGLPVDLLRHFGLDEQSLRGLCRRLSGGEDASLLIAQLRARDFEFRPTRPGFRIATEDGAHEIGMLRLQLTRGTLWRGQGAGGCLDVARQLVESLPQVQFVASIEQRHLESFQALAGTWPLRERGRLTLLAEPLVVSQWAQDNGKAGLVDGRIATIVPRYASRREDGSVFVPNESFLMDGLAGTGHEVIHSPLLFQGGNLLAMRDPATGQRILLIGEAEVYRNTALGLSVEQVFGAFRAELGVDRCVVLPAVSFHLDYDVSVRAQDGGIVAFVNDTDAALGIVIDLGLGALEAHGTLDRAAARAARAHLEAGRLEELLEIVRGTVLATADDRGRFPLSLAQHFAVGPVDSPVANLQRFLAALDATIARGLAPDLWPEDRHSRSFYASFERRRADRQRLHAGLRELGWKVVPVPSLADAEVSLIAINGIQDPTRYLMPAYGGFYTPLDDAAAAALGAELGDGVQVIRILCGESQRRVGAVHCSVSVYPRP